jgi:aconitate decarboxylase
MHGLEAALLASRGFTADSDALGGPRGYGQTYFGDRFESAPLLTPVSMPRVLDPGPAWKLFPSQYATHFAITAALECRGTMSETAELSQVTITTPVMPYIDRPQPNSGLDGKFSYQYCVAAALLDGRVDLATFSDDRRFAPDMAALLARIVLSQTTAIPGQFDAMHVDVSVTLADGSRVMRRCAAPPGSWSRPIAPALIETKARDLLDAVLSKETACSFWSLIAMPSNALRISDLMRSLM